MRRTVAFLIAVAAFGLSPTRVAAQGNACHPADSVSARMVRWITHVVTGTDVASAQQRTQMSLPQVSASQITYVTDKAVCNKALDPYNANSLMQDVTTGTAVAPSGLLYVVKVGTVYVVTDPVKMAGEFALYVTLDSRYRFLARSLG